MRGFALRRRAALDDVLEYVEIGSVAGGLYDLGRYPGLVVGGPEATSSRVRGEVYRIVEPRVVLARVDAIEDHRAQAPRAGEYQRVALPATLTDGRALDVWAYVYNRSTATATSIRGGDYRTYVEDATVAG